MQGAKNSRVLDPTKFLKITKVGASPGVVQGSSGGEVWPCCVCPGKTVTCLRVQTGVWGHLKWKEDSVVSWTFLFCCSEGQEDAAAFSHVHGVLLVTQTFS